MMRFSNFMALPRLTFSLAFQVNWRKAALATVLILVIPVAMPFAALASRAVTDAVVDQDESRALIGAVVLALLWIVPAIVAHLEWGVFVELIDLSHLEFESRVIQMTNGPGSLAHLEQPEFANRLEMLRNDARELWYALSTLAFVIGVLIQFAITLALLVSVEPYLALLLLCALPWVAAEIWSERRIELTKLAVATQARTARHMLELMTTRSHAQEIRIFRLGAELRRRQTELWREIDRATFRAETHVGLVRALGQLTFGVAVGAAIYLVTRSVIDGQHSVGDVVMLLSLSVGISQQIGSAVGAVTKLQVAAKAAQRFYWLERLVRRSSVRSGEGEMPSTIEKGLYFEHVEFRYPGTNVPILNDFSLHIPAGTVVALVGENGAGKTTVTKLLSRFYDVTSGRITLDGRDISDYSVKSWQSRISASFQEAYRYDLIAREAIGIGYLPRIEDIDAVRSAVGRAGASEVIAGLPDGLSTQLGSSYAAGTDLSGGQWQKVGLARGMMRPSPLLLLLDEPASALDAQAEHELFDRYAAAARDEGAKTGAITLFTSHRFSTVRMADLIVVLHGGEIVEAGTHDELRSRGGIYAELYLLQAAAYVR